MFDFDPYVIVFYHLNENVILEITDISFLHPDDCLFLLDDLFF